MSLYQGSQPGNLPRCHSSHLLQPRPPLTGSFACHDTSSAQPSLDRCDGQEVSTATHVYFLDLQVKARHLNDDFERVVDSMLVGVPGSIPALQDIPGSQAVETVFARRIANPTLLPPHLLYKDSNRGILLFGPSGCGKTFIAQSFAKTSGWTYILCQLLHRWNGVSELYEADAYRSLAAPC